MAEITGVLLDAYNDMTVVMTVEAELQSYYTMLDCSCIDIVSRKIGGKWFDIVCDDEGLLVDDPKISAINNLGRPMLVGNLFIVKHKGDDIGSLTEKDIEHVMKHIQVMYTKNHPEGYMMLTQVDY